MESDKSRGLKHIKDKRKYKGNSTKISKYVPPKTQPNLESNWYRYEDNDTIENQDNLKNNFDFSVLADAPITKGTHFLTKAEKLLANETKSTSFDGLFNLNLRKLEDNLLAIPFYKRIGIDEKYFTENQINDMVSVSKEHMDKIIKLNKQHDQISNDLQITTEEINIESPKDLVTEQTSNIENLILEDSLHVETISSGKAKDNSDELEKWLDDFLDE